MMRVRALAYNRHGTIDCEIEHPVYGWIPFTATPDDDMEHGRVIYAEAVAGELGPVAPYEPPPRDEAALRETAKQRVDVFAGEVRARFSAPGDLIIAEYYRAEAMATQYLAEVAAAAGDPTGITVPRAVEAWRRNGGFAAAVDAAQDLLNTKAAWDIVLDVIRDHRTDAKAAIDDAPDGSDYDAVAQPYLDLLDAICPDPPPPPSE